MKKLAISIRSLRTPFSPVRKLAGLAAEAHARGIDVYNLNIGEPDLATPRAFFRAMRQYSPRTVSYAPSSGFAESLDAWIRYYRRFNVRLTREQLIMTSGGSEAILFAFSVVADPGDEIIVFEPLYPNFISLARMLGIRLVPITLDARRGYRLPARDQVMRRCTRRTKAILVCNPSNPTGTVLSVHDRRMIASVVQKTDLFLIADETYREFTDGHPHCFLSERQIAGRVILVDSASKRFNVCGARVGCVATKNRECIEAMLKYAQARLSTPSIEQLATIPLLTGAPAFTERFRADYRSRIAAAVDGLSRIPGVRFVRPHGAFYCMASLPVDDTERFCRWLLTDFSYRNRTVLLAPGSGFYVSKGCGRHEVRIACVIAPARIKHACVLLERALSEYAARSRRPSSTHPR